MLMRMTEVGDGGSVPLPFDHFFFCFFAPAAGAMFLMWWMREIFVVGSTVFNCLAAKFRSAHEGLARGSMHVTSRTQARIQPCASCYPDTLHWTVRHRIAPHLYHVCDRNANRVET